MQVVPFGTLKIAKRLEKSGLSSQQAETRAEVQRDTLAELAEGHLATKADVAQVKTELKAEIAEVKAEIVQIKSDLAQVKTELTQVKTELKADIHIVHWMMGLTLSGVGALLFRLFFGA